MKRKKHNEIIKSSVEGYSKGFKHRRHRAKRRNHKKETLQIKKDTSMKEQEREWERIRKCYNIIGDED